MEETLVRVALIHGREKDHLFIAAHHLVVDGVSWRILAGDLERAYGAALSGAAIRLPEKTHTYRDYAEALRRYRNSYALRQEIPYWEATEEKMKGLPLSRAKDYSRSFGTIVVTMEREATAKFLKGDFAKIHGEINDALLAAVGRSFAKVQGVTAVSFQMEGHGRENLGETLLTDRTVGWFTSVYPVVVDGLTGDLLHDLLAVKEALHRVPNKGVGYNVLRFIEGEKKVEFTSDFAAQIGFNYLGDMSVEEREGDSHFTGSRIDTGESFSRKNVFGPDLSINCLVMNGSFRLDLSYAQSLWDSEKARQFARGILAEMEDIASFLKEYDGSRLTATDLGENEWSEVEFEAVLARFAERGERIERIYPLLPMQEGMLLKHVTEPESWAYRLVSIFEMDWVPEESQLRRALDRLGKKHEVLRTAILHENVSVPRQAIVDRPLGLAMRDLSGEADPEAAVKRLREEILSGGFDMEKKPLFSLTCAKKDGESCYVVLAVHHIIVDGWCISLYLGDLVQYLREEKQGRLTEDRPAPLAGVYERAVREILQQDKEQGLAYWRGLLGGYETKAEISSYGEVPEEERAAEDECSISLDEDTTERLVDLCRKAGATPGNGVELLWGLVLSVCSRAEDVVFAKVVSGRDHTETDVNDLVGLLINSVPVRLKLEKTTTAQEALAALQEQTAESNRYDYCPLTSIQQQTELGVNLFQTVLGFENYNSGNEDIREEDFLRPLVMREEHFDEINPSAYIQDGQMHLRISFQPSKYREKEIRRVLDLFKTLAEGIVRHPERPLSALARLNLEEREEMLRISRGEKLAYNQKETWLDLFLHHAKNTPEKTAVVDSRGAFTYGDLDRASDSIAIYLLKNGVVAGDFVALKMGRVKEFFAAVIAVHKVGAAYVPVDPEYPEERIRYMLEDSEAKAVLTAETVAETLAKYPEAESVNRAAPEGRAYMIYTSGSTGRPKGVVQSHRSLRALVAWMLDKFDIAEESVHAEHPSFSFDASLMDLFCPLSAGGTLHIFSEALNRDMAEMKEYMVGHHISMATFSTQIGMAMVNQYPELPLRYLMMGGEKMLPCKRTNIRLINGYGPTEFTVCSSYHLVDQERDADIPIGRPVPNTYSFICDTYGHLLPQGMAGELCLAGSQIAEGYWKQPELTEKSFVACSFLPGQKMYRTGDLARYNEAGELEYLGRIDNQVKLRGFRIEMGEIETR
ncbi:MAG: amino acid adenylation domain-containing protein, partial [Selenomonadaceae bacterium]|nr:amino acid adenylation domain-containing protein [Selenomonadaceae bacterium]